MKIRSFLILICLILVVGIVGCGQKKPQHMPAPEQEEDDGLIVVGFSQVGAESDWRKAHTQSISTFLTKENGFKLIIDDAQQKQSNQITAIRTFIQQEVDYIILAPVTETGWDTVLGEAKDAGIPVIVVDRMVSVSDESLYTCWVGSNFELEARKACEWLRCYLETQDVAPENIHIVDIQGTIGSSAQIGRSNGLQDAIWKNGWNLLGADTGEYTRAKGREVMANFLRKYDTINVVYCENDNEAFGAIDALEAEGKTVGTDIGNGEILVISFDGVSEQALAYINEGKIACIGECNPDHGPRVQRIIGNLEAGIVPEKMEYVYERVFSSVDVIKHITVDNRTYMISQVGDINPEE